MKKKEEEIPYEQYQNSAPAPAFPQDPLLLVYWKALHSLLYPEYCAAPTPTPSFPRFPTGRCGGLLAATGGSEKSKESGLVRLGPWTERQEDGNLDTAAASHTESSCHVPSSLLSSRHRREHLSCGRVLTAAQR